MRVSGVVGAMPWAVLGATLAWLTYGVVDRQEVDGYRPDGSLGDTVRTTDLLVAFVASSNCAGSSRSDLPPALDEMRTILQNRAHGRGHRFSAIGVSVDWDVDAGVEFLMKLGAWDEILVGRQWLGMGATTFVWRDKPGDASLPQVILFQRSIRVGKTRIEVGQDSVLKRVVGVDSIISWVRQRATWGERTALRRLDSETARP